MSETVTDSTETRQLLARLQAGEAEAFDQLFARHRAYLQQVIDMDLNNQSINDTQVYEACNSISAGPAFAIVSPGEVTFRAPSIVLKNGFSVGANAKFTAVNVVP